MSIRGAVLQLTSSDDPADNTATVRAMLEDAAQGGAQIVFTPEVTNCVSLDRARQADILRRPDEDETLRDLRATAKSLGLWLHLGSLAVKTDDPDGRFANRSFLIDNSGEIRATYDKIHMFDVDIGEGESFRESRGYRPGQNAVLTDSPFGRFGLTICYDMRFPLLYAALSAAGAQILTVPSAFSPTTGAAHWHSLLRARAIENGCYVIAAAQTGTHPSQSGKARRTFGHSLVVSPWGEVILDAGTEPGVYEFDFDLENVEDARRRIPSLANRRPFDPPA